MAHTICHEQSIGCRQLYRRVVGVARGRHCASPRPIVRVQAASSADPQLPEPMQSQVAYVKAFITVATRHAVEAALDAAATVNVYLAEQPRRMQDFQDEIQTLADRERRGGGQRLLTSRSSASGSQGTSSSNGSSAASQTTDLAALVDELRADIASCRSLIQQMRVSQQAASR